MKTILSLLTAVVLAVLFAPPGQRSASAAGTAVILDIDGTIGPATADYVRRGIAEAAAGGAVMVILRMDTPGGLDTSMREIVRTVLDSSIPVVGFVAPSGAHAASAGTFILYATHVAAMAPGTNLGAATPVAIGAPGMPSRPTKPNGDGAVAKKPGIEEKGINDAVAYIRSLAQMRGRNAEWAEKAVREAASLPAEEAVAAGAVDLTARDVQDLLGKLEGRTVDVKGVPRTLATQNVETRSIEPDWRTRLLAVITNPNVAYILLLLGLYGLLFEFYSPGLIGPGVIGAICLLLALYALHVLPVSYTGLALLLLGVALMIGEAVTPGFGVLGTGGIAAFVAGSVMLMDTSVPGFEVAWPLTAGIALAAAALMMAMLMMLMRARRRAVVSGTEQLLGSSAEVVDWQGRRGRVRIMGETWNARADADIPPRGRVRIARVDGLTLVVEPEDLRRSPS